MQHHRHQFQFIIFVVAGLIWARYSMVIIPKNWLLFSVNIGLGITGVNQLCRIAQYVFYCCIFSNSFVATTVKFYCCQGIQINLPVGFFLRRQYYHTIHVPANPSFTFTRKVIRLRKSSSRESCLDVTPYTVNNCKIQMSCNTVDNFVLLCFQLQVFTSKIKRIN